MPKGKVQKIVKDKGYGFIQAEDGKELFFHATELRGLNFKDVKKGNQVEFDVRKDKWGRPVAVNIRSSR